MSVITDCSATCKNKLSTSQVSVVHELPQNQHPCMPTNAITDYHILLVLDSFQPCFTAMDEMHALNNQKPVDKISHMRDDQMPPHGATRG